MQRFPTLRARDLDLGSGHTAYHRASLIDLYHKPNFIEIKILFVDRRMDGGTFETHFTRSTQKIKPETHKKRRK